MTLPGLAGCRRGGGAASPSGARCPLWSARRAMNRSHDLRECRGHPSGSGRCTRSRAAGRRTPDAARRESRTGSASRLSPSIVRLPAWRIPRQQTHQPAVRAGPSRQRIPAEGRAGPQEAGGGEQEEKGSDGRACRPASRRCARRLWATGSAGCGCRPCRSRSRRSPWVPPQPTCCRTRIPAPAGTGCARCLPRRRRGPADRRELRQRLLGRRARHRQAPRRAPASVGSGAAKPRTVLTVALVFFALAAVAGLIDRAGAPSTGGCSRSVPCALAAAWFYTGGKRRTATRARRVRRVRVLRPRGDRRYDVRARGNRHHRELARRRGRRASSPAPCSWSTTSATATQTSSSGKRTLAVLLGDRRHPHRLRGADAAAVRDPRVLRAFYANAYLVFFALLAALPAVRIALTAKTAPELVIALRLTPLTALALRAGTRLGDRLLAPSLSTQRCQLVFDVGVASLAVRRGAARCRERPHRAACRRRCRRRRSRRRRR